MRQLFFLLHATYEQLDFAILILYFSFFTTLVGLIFFIYDFY